MRRSAAALLGLLLLLSPAAADEQAPEPPTPEQAADAVLEAVKAKDDAALRALAEEDKPDPWLVADELCFRGRHEAAAAFARAAPRKAVEKLPHYVTARRGAEPEEEARKTLAAAKAASGRSDWQDVLDATEDQTGPLASVVRIQVAFERGLALRKTGRHVDAAQALTAVAQACRTLGWLAQARTAFHQAGSSAAAGRDHAGARSAWTARLDIERELDNKPGEASVLNNLGVIHRNLGLHEQALRYYTESLAIRRELGDKAGMIKVLNNVGSLYRKMGRHAAAFRYHDEALEIAVELDQRAEVANTLNNIGVLHKRLGNYELALKYYDRSLVIKRELDDQPGIAIVHGNIGVAYELMGLYAKALSNYGETLRIRREAGDKAAVAVVLHNMGSIQSRQRNYPAARKQFEESLAIWRELGIRRRYVALALTNLGVVLKKMGKYPEALEAYAQAREYLEQAPDRLAQARSCWGPAEVYLLQGRFAEAARWARRGVEHAIGMSSGLAQGEGAGARDLFSELFDTGYLAALRAGQAEDLLWFMEQGRAGSLREELGSRGALEAAVIPAELHEALARARRAEQSALGAYLKAQRAGDLAVTRAARRRWSEAQAQVVQAAARIQREAKLAASVTLTDPDDLETIQGHLQPDEALVMFGLTHEEALALVVRRDEVHTRVLSASKDIAQAIEALMEDPKHYVVPGRAGALHELLIEPLALGRDVKRVLVSPTGRLGYVPFALLFPEREVAYVPSGTAHGLLVRAHALRGEKILALGAPDYKTLADAAIAKHRGAALHELNALPATRGEVEAIGTTRLLGAKASESGLQGHVDQGGRWRAVHFACHGLVDPDRPMFSALALTADEKNDGFLTALEIFRMHIPADLVVLSACETGRGKIYKTEGIVGLTRAFMFAGAPRVICSLWKVDDEATQALMIRFYELWNPPAKPGDPEQGPKGRVEGSERRGLGAAAALKKAQAYVRDHPDHPEWKHPYYWAAWVLWGLPD